MSANEAAIANWNGTSGQRWAATADDRDAALIEVLDVLLDVAGLRPGEGVLDLGCGCGATTLAAGTLVEPGGSVVGYDLSAPMLEVAQRRAETGGIANVSFTTADVQTVSFPPASFDVAISRFGTMFFEDPVAAFANVAGALRLGGRLCVATWQPFAVNEWLTVPAAAVLGEAALPEGTVDPGAPGMFAQSDPGVIAATLGRAGFVDVDVRPVAVRLRLGDDAPAAAAYLADTGIGRALLDPLSDAERAAAVATVTTAFAAHELHGDGVRLGGAIFVTTTRR